MNLGGRAWCLEFSSFLTVKFPSFRSATAAVTQKCFLVMLVVCAEPPFLRQVGGELSVEGLADVVR